MQHLFALCVFQTQRCHQSHQKEAIAERWQKLPVCPLYFDGEMTYKMTSSFIELESLTSEL